MRNHAETRSMKTLYSSSTVPSEGTSSRINSERFRSRLKYMTITCRQVPRTRTGLRLWEVGVGLRSQRTRTSDIVLQSLSP